MHKNINQKHKEKIPKIINPNREVRICSSYFRQLRPKEGEERDWLLWKALVFPVNEPLSMDGSSPCIESLTFAAHVPSVSSAAPLTIYISRCVCSPYHPDPIQGCVGGLTSPVSSPGPRPLDNLIGTCPDFHVIWCLCGLSLL